LNTVLFPGGPLPLRIFETRYLDMLSRCLKSDAGFGVCLIEQGSETGRARTYTVGTLARVRDWSNDADGLLHILATGERRFRIVRMRAQHDGLYLGEVEWLPDESPLPLPESAQPLAELLRTLLAPMTERYATITEAYDDSSWVGYRLAELLPLPVKQRQHLLELSDAQLRLDVIAALVQSQAEPNSV
ncbi:MAG: LON peptidase substrate-binding domain-containing protein, partial [Gammaproteobacteria bacterium]|nr:LON peptidase substrate-binding domain-containing protein [Gammaproteobacteria bacterium]